jgi:D-alanine transaminase
MPKTVFYNGKFYGKGKAVIPICDRAIFFGDAVYDAVIGHDGGLFLLDEHLERLISNAKMIDLTIPYTIERLRSISYNVVKKSKLREYFLYLQLSRCSEERTHAYPSSQSASLLITVSPFSLSPSEKRLKLVTTADKRYGFCNIKTVNLLPAVIASHGAEAAGCDEAIFVRDGFVTECAHSNIAILKDGVLITHPDSTKILPGIAKKHLLSTARAEGIDVEERPFSTEELFSADEVIVSSTTKLLLSAESIDGKTVGGGDGKRFAVLQAAVCEEFNNYTYK